jgi:propionyl-CoA synthetase
MKVVSTTTDHPHDPYAQSLASPEAFWARAAEAIDWEVVPTRIVDATDSARPRWFSDGVLNTCANALDRHVEGGRADQPAIIHDSPVTETVRTYTYAEVLAQVTRTAGALRGLGVTRGDRVVIYMPAVPEAIFAMLACARLGAIHSVVFGGFAPPQLAARIDDARPHLVLYASCGIEGGRIVSYKPLVDRAMELATHRVEGCVVLRRPQCRVTLGAHDHDWETAVAEAAPVDPVLVDANDPLYILYTSGTTGRPKGIVRDNGGHAVALAWTMRHVYSSGPGQVFWAASDVGWVVGHSYIVYAPLLIGATTVLYEGKPVGTPDSGAFWRVAARHGVEVMFTAPTALRAIRREDPDGDHIRRHDLSALRALFLAGERTDPDTFQWAVEQLGIAVVDHWWQTETGWPIAANCLGLRALPAKPGSCTRPVPGWDVRVLGPDGGERPAGVEGELAVRLPLPPGAATTLWGDPAGYERAYLSAHRGFYSCGDGGYFDDDGYLFVQGRTDDVINVAAHRLSTGVLEQAAAAHAAVAEAAVVGVTDELKGEVPVVLLVLKAGTTNETDVIRDEVRDRIRADVGPIATPRSVIVVDRLPKTRSGKVLRSTIRLIARGAEYQMPATIEDPAVLAEIETALAARTRP